MTVLWAGSKLLLLALLFLVSGCGSQLQRSLNRSVMIAERCADIEEAVPVKKEELKLALVNAISVRLLAKCANGSQHCLNPAPSQTVLPDPLAAAKELARNLKIHRDRLDGLNKQLAQSNRATVQMLQIKYGTLDQQLDAAHRDASTALAELYQELNRAKTTLDSSFLDARACERRTNCVAALAQRLVVLRPQIEGKIKALHQSVARLQVLGEHAALLTEQTASFIATVPAVLAATADAQQQTIAAANEQLTHDTARLAGSSKFFIRRLEDGARALESLFSAEVQKAATAFMAARLYDRAADRTLGAIDRMLAQLDRTIDQVDEHVYGVATIGTYVFQSEMQDKLNHVFKTLVVDRLPDDENAHTAKLAFAAAACRRLAPENGQEVKNASMFSPFVFAALVDIEAGLRKESPESVRGKWEASLHKTIDQTQPPGSAPYPKFIELVANAYIAESSTERGNKPVAPSMLQQVALCANVEQELATTQQLSADELLNRTRAACGKAVVAATMMGEALPDASNPAVARLAIEKAPLSMLEAGPSSQPGSEDAAAWRRAMEAVLAATAAKQPSHLDLLCQRIKSATSVAQCDAGAANGAVTLDFNASFSSGKPYDQALEIHMARLADLLNDGKQTYIVTVYGYASASPFPCRRPASRPAVVCGVDKNFALAQARADWAMDVLKKRLRDRIAAESSAIGQFNPLSFDTPADRRIRMTVSLRN